MSVKSDLIAALGSLASNRCYFDVFSQGVTPTWPAIRISFISGEIDPDICGDGTDATDNLRVQIDCATLTGIARDSLRASIRTAMAAFVPPARLEGSARESYDADLKVFQASMDYVIYQSS